MTDGLPPVRRVVWEPCVRVVPSRFPPIALFERVADPSDFDSVYAIEALTNSRLRDEVGELTLVPAGDRVSGPGASWVMAPFTHISGPGGRFSTGAFGAYYCARTLDTAIAETRHHRERFLRATQEGALEISMRVIHATLDAELHDLRGLKPKEVHRLSREVGSRWWREASPCDARGHQVGLRHEGLDGRRDTRGDPAKLSEGDWHADESGFRA